MEEKGLSLMENSKNEERGLDELIEPLIIETSDYKKMRLDRTIYTQFKLFNDFAEIRNSNRKEKRSGDEILKLNIPFKIMNKLVNLMWENTKFSIFYTANHKYKKVFHYLGFQPEKVKIFDKITGLIFKDDSVLKFIKKYNERSDIYYLNEEIVMEYKDILSDEDIKMICRDGNPNIRILTKYVEGNKYTVDLYLTDVYPKTKTFKWKVYVFNENPL